MLFNSVEFLFLFLPVTLACFYAAPFRWRLPILTLASLVFYGTSGFVPLAALVIGMSWGLGFVVYARKYQSAWLLLISMAIPLLILANYKYQHFLFVSIPSTLGLGSLKLDTLPVFLRILLPAGISFYTFQIISFCIDFYKKGFVIHFPYQTYFLYIIFFPQLIAGPILRYTDVSEQFLKISRERPVVDLPRSLKFILVGLAEKIFLADVPGIWIDRFHDGLSAAVEGSQSLSISDASIYILLYSAQIYFDFAAYSLMAIGIAQLFGICLPRNFREPYMSQSPKEFWRRWHITLSYWLRDYIYLSMGGNKRYYKNIIVVFLASGLWHGAGFSFVIWGLYHALLVLFYHLTSSYWMRLSVIARISVTFVLVSLGWPLFDIGARGYLNLASSITLLSWKPQIFAGYEVLYLGLILFLIFFVREDRFVYGRSPLGILESPIVQAVMLSACLAFINFSTTFIYFRF